MKTNLYTSNSNMKKFVLKTSIFVFIILTILVSVNYLGDSAHLFSEGYEAKISDIIFKNKNATNISNYDERILQKEIIYKLKTKPDIVVIGSSRTMLINSTFFKNKKFINNSVSGASIEDLIAIYQMYKSRKILPKKIILGIDPWLFNKNNGQTRWKSIEKYYYSFFQKNIKKETYFINDKFKQLFSFSYFQSSIKNLPKIIKGKTSPIPTNEIYNQSNTKLVDLSLSYGENYRNVSVEQVMNKANNYTSGRMYSIENFKVISPEIFIEFEELCNDILNNNIELSFFLAPYHPLVYKRIQKEYPMVLKNENKIIEYAKKNGIECYGSFNPSRINIDNSGFYDGMHSKEKTIKKILKVRTHNNIYKSLGEW